MALSVSSVVQTPRRRWLRLRYSLKTLFWATTAVAIWLGIGVYRAEREQTALPIIAAAGGEWAYSPSFFYPFTRVYVVSFTGRKFTDVDLAAVAPHLQRLSGLSFLQFMQTGITDEGLTHLNALTQIGILHLVDNEISDAGLKHIRQLPALYELDLSATLVSDAGLQYIETMQGLTKVSVPGAMPAGIALPDDPILARMREEIIEETSVPGIISKTAIKSFQKARPSCTMTQTSFTYSGSTSN